MKLKHWIKIIIFVFLAALVFFFASELLCVANEKDSVGVYGFFLEPKDSIDVVLIGSSSVYSSFYSPLAYEQQGFTSYALSTSTMTGALYRYAAEIAVEQQHPQLLVFDTFSFCYDIQQDETSLRKFIDALPESEIKQRAIDDIVPEELRDSFRHPFEKYHASWTRIGELVQVLQDKIWMKNKGYSITKNYATTPLCIEYVRQAGEYHISEAGFTYLKALLDYLQAAGVEHALFIRTPEMIHYENTDSYTEMIDMIRNAGYDFVNLNAAVQDMELDMNHDFYNTTHLNIFGAEKFTTLLADYIMKRYQLDISHSEQVEQEWIECADANSTILPYLEELTEQNTDGFLYVQKDFLNRSTS